MLGASTVDGIYCFVVVLGLGCNADFLREEQRALALLTDLVLVALGLWLFHSKPAVKPIQSAPRNLGHAFVSSLLLMLTNPAPILAFSAVFASLGIHGSTADHALALVLVAGFFTGSALWGPILVAAARSLGRQAGPARMIILHKALGLLIFFFGFGAGLLQLLHGE